MSTFLIPVISATAIPGDILSMNIAQLLARSASVFPHHPAIQLGDRLLFDYRTLAARAASIAG
ncbi:MAG: hypothetical protein Q8M83_02945 [bacterium]|nr:hypothetical protein [bacterium]